MQTPAKPFLHLFCNLGLGVVLSLAISGCNRSQEVPPEDIALIRQDPMPSQTRSLIGQPRPIRDQEPDAVPEAIAKSLLQQLASWEPDGKDWAQSLRECAALHAFEVNARQTNPCENDYTGEPDMACLLNKGYGQKTMGQILMADRFDLNGDGVKDYLISDRYYCNQLSANQSSAYFVMLSGPEKAFHLAYADWASYGLEVFQHPKTQQPVVVERAGKTYGTYSRIHELRNGRLVERSCIVEDAQGVGLCPQPQ
jgi:hypothetical protein